MRVAACFGLAPADLRSNAYSGSRSAVDRVRSEGRALYLSDERDRAWLKDRASVLAQKITALVCLPLLHEGELLGIAYADTSAPAHVFTESMEVSPLKVGSAQLAQLTAWVAVDSQGATRAAGAAEIWPSAAT